LNISSTAQVESIKTALGNFVGKTVYGPVHLNLQLEEPLYDDISAQHSFELAPIYPIPTVEDDIQVFVNALSVAENLLWLNGAATLSIEDKKALSGIKDKLKGNFVSDIISGVHYLQSATNWEWILLTKQSQIKKALGNYLLVTTGTSHLSKNLKQFVRSNPPVTHLHISTTGLMKDQFDTKPQLIKCRLSTVEKAIELTCNFKEYFGAYNQELSLHLEKTFDK